MKTPEELNRLRDEKAEQRRNSSWAPLRRCLDNGVGRGLSDKERAEIERRYGSALEDAVVEAWNAAIEAVQGEQQESPTPDGKRFFSYEETKALADVAEAIASDLAAAEEKLAWAKEALGKIYDSDWGSPAMGAIAREALKKLEGATEEKLRAKELRE